MLHPRTLQLIMDSLRYWVTEMHVDGFRFDLAPVLARELFEVNRLSAFFDIIHQDPVLSRVKLIAEPWDLGPGGYQVGNFPDRLGRVERQVSRRRAPLLARRRGHGRPSSRRGCRDRATSTSGARARRTRASTSSSAHDGFTLNDLVSYEQKHNEANGENNRDGTDDNLSRNWGVEGPTDDPQVVRARDREMRNFLATLAFSQGVPMIAARRRDRAHAGRQQQRVRAGQRDLVDELGSRRAREGTARVHAAAVRASGARTPRCAGATSFAASRSSRARRM